MVMYMFLSVLATFLTEGMIFAGIYFYETEILAGEYRKVWGASGQGRLALGCSPPRSRYRWTFS